MRYLLRDLFSDVIEAAKEAGIWQTLTLNEKEEVVDYFLRHFNSLIEEARRLVFPFDDVVRTRRATAAGVRRNRA
jgi:hypothetical protein